MSSPLKTPVQAPTSDGLDLERRLRPRGKPPAARRRLARGTEDAAAPGAVLFDAATLHGHDVREVTALFEPRLAATAPRVYRRPWLWVVFLLLGLCGALMGAGLALLDSGF